MKTFFQATPPFVYQSHQASCPYLESNWGRLRKFDMSSVQPHHIFNREAIFVGDFKLSKKYRYVGQFHFHRNGKKVPHGFGRKYSHKKKTALDGFFEEGYLVSAGLETLCSGEQRDT
eukprot:CAMPEP_0170491550 /NCGR_PEP_ID=MMETSP0208-20121228/11116_1 /TAXON_ID=197538 /ORGANISM="Strombidium inclinatum, Strain S3" /LENGTH=116 /DNA_ID=CAMNT_0010767141 /DNA_START=435 /DNA_END=782 /DNA_ORIENTATION=+